MAQFPDELAPRTPFFIYKGVVPGQSVLPALQALTFRDFNQLNKITYETKIITQNNAPAMRPNSGGGKFGVGG